MDGSLATEPRGTSGFGCDPVFIRDSDSGHRTYAQMTSEEKNKISPQPRGRGNAKRPGAPMTLLAGRRGPQPGSQGSARRRSVRRSRPPPGGMPSRAHTAPVRARPFPAPGNPAGPGIRPGCGRPRPACRACQYPPHAAVAHEVPADLPLRASAAAATAPRKHLAAVPRITGRQPTCLIVSASVSAMRVPFTSRLH